MTTPQSPGPDARKALADECARIASFTISDMPLYAARDALKKAAIALRSPSGTAGTREEVARKLCCPNGCPRDKADCWAFLPRYNYLDQADGLLSMLSLSHEAPAQEPVAWGRIVDGKAITVSRDWTPANDEPLYAAPASHEATPDDDGVNGAEAIAKLREFDRFGLVIESAVRTADGPNWPRISALIKRTRVFMSILGPAPIREDRVQAGSGEAGAPIGHQAVERAAVSALTRLAAECHRAKWQFDHSGEGRLPTAQARDLIRRAFDELHKVGDLALKERDALRSVPAEERKFSSVELLRVAIADGFNNGNQQYEDCDAFMRMRFDAAARAVAALYSSHAGCHPSGTDPDSSPGQKVEALHEVSLTPPIRADRAVSAKDREEDESPEWLLACRLAGAELNYRNAYQTRGPSHSETGRYWDKMRKAGDAIRAHEPNGLVTPPNCEKGSE